MRKLTTLILVLCFVTISAAARPLTQRPLGPEEEPRIYEIKWRAAKDIAGILSGIFPVYSTSDVYNTVTVSARPEQHPLVQELIRKYDVPAKTIEFQFHVLRASKAGQGIRNGVSEQIQKVLKEVSSLTKYGSFELLDTPVLRATEGKFAAVSGKGVFFYHLRIHGPSIVEPEQGKRVIRVDEFEINFEILMGAKEGQPIFKNVGVHTAFTIKDQETVVVGASQIQADSQTGDAIITVVTAKILD